MEFGWAYLVPAIAVAGGITYVILKSYWKSRGQIASTSGNSELRAALDASTAASRAILDRLESIETRLGTVEKTLTDIP
jgi:hypothetical protein